MRTFLHVALGISLALTSLHASAVTVVSTVPEPGALSLLGIGAVAGLAIWIKRRNNKK